MVKVTDADQIKHMVERFLCWKLPRDFHPDAGIKFEPGFNVEYNAKHGRPPQRHEPTGTNLFNYTQAVEMVRHMVAEISENPHPSPDYIAGIVEGRAMAAPQDHWTVQAAIRAARALIAAGDALSAAAQTSGGTAGRDDYLCAAIAHWAADRDKWKSALRIIELEGDDPEIGAGSPNHPFRNINPEECE